MNLKNIIDAKKDYAHIPEGFESNFYFVLANKVVSLLTPQNQNSNLSLQVKVLGNPVKVSFGKNDITVSINNKSFKESGTSLSILEKCIYDIFQAELKGDVSISRPEGKSVLTDRNQFNKWSNTMFSKLYKSVAYDKEGKRNAEVLGSRSNAVALTPRQYENASQVPSFKKENFEAYASNGVSFWKNKNADVIDFSNTTFEGIDNISISDFAAILKNQDSNSGVWARTDDLYKLYENIESYKSTIALYKGRAWIIIPTQSAYRVIDFI